jgi:hypothetical protein
MAVRQANAGLIWSLQAIAGVAPSECGMIASPEARDPRSRPGPGAM